MSNEDNEKLQVMLDDLISFVMEGCITDKAHKKLALDAIDNLELIVTK